MKDDLKDNEDARAAAQAEVEETEEALTLEEPSELRAGYFPPAW